jgi:hypothetical protein
MVRRCFPVIGSWQRLWVRVPSVSIVLIMKRYVRSPFALLQAFASRTTLWGLFFFIRSFGLHNFTLFAPYNGTEGSENFTFSRPS